MGNYSLRDKRSGRKSYGFIAQDIEQVYPELIHEVDGIKRVDYVSFIGILCAKIKNLEEEMKNFKKK